ncbi:ABC transporter ATP-binding protein [Thalassococcus lentus]|uniref:ABC transporter ATP-binding protein n=1 Tax=Thalassococcus lentus TaxID=1210524 RepID=A0ABT4XQY2_9RHOB|nr:ABC transporter ATP-binding protein [Thalassococcus lentus]MDA7424359.1 ABC transporter ATP-binding protein [Thalassococcus lentus]
MSLSVSDLSFSYGAKPALDAVSFDVAAGRFCALLGPNGAGKSTLFGLLTQLFSSADGRIEIAGHDLQKAPRAALAAMGVVFQQPTLDLDLSVRQNLRYFAALQGLSGKTAETRIDAALDQLDMRQRAGEKARGLNGGHRRRTEIARALLHHPKVLLLDEPTVGLDAAARQSLVAHVHELALGGISVLWATHLTDEVQMQDDLVLLHQGRIRARGVTGDLVGGQALQDWFLAETGVAA